MKRPLILSLLSALLLSAGWLGLSGIPLLVAFVPLLLISDGCDDSRRGWWRMAGWTALSLGLWSAATTWWIWYAAPVGPVLSVIITAVLFGGVLMLYHTVRRRAPRPLAWLVLVCGWIAAEYLYTVGEVSFPWLVLGNGFANDVWLVQWYSITGVFGGSLWVLLSNAAVYSFLVRRSARRAASAAAVVLLPAAVSLVMYFTFDPERGRPVEVAVVQPNIDPWNSKFDTPQWYQDSIIFAVAGCAPDDVELIVTPETAADGIYENDFRTVRQMSPYRGFLAGRFPTARMILGATTVKFYDRGEPVSPTARMGGAGTYWYDYYNSAILVDTTSSFEVHHKSMLTPGVEKMPFYSITKHLESLIVDLGGINGQLGCDSRRKVFDAGDSLRVATAICYESIYGAYVAEFVKGGAQLLAVITNDGWWGDTPGYRQHFSYSRLRAVETRRDIARSANTGISGFINGRGDVMARTGWWEQALLADKLRARDGETFYVRYGDFVARLCCYVFGLAVAYYIAYRFRKRDNLI